VNLSQNQKTLAKPVSVEGLGLFGGKPCLMRMMPAGVDQGIGFVRTDIGPARVSATISQVAPRPRRTALTDGKVEVETVEHVLSALAGMGVDNATVELSAAETPSTDGSPLPFVRAIQEAGVQEQNAPRRPLVITEAVAVSHGEAMIAALPGPTDWLDVLYDLDYSNMPSIGRQVLGFRLGKDNYVSQLAPARTFLLEQEAREFQSKGIGVHLTTREVLVMGADGPIDNELRFDDEHVRHKVCDLVGDLALLGRPLHGRVVAYKSGHELNHMLVRRLAQAATSTRNPARQFAGEVAMDIRSIMKLLPHRYPFLMVDRILHAQGDERIVGIKNVSVNEPFFQGHYPNQPIMPGVMILEALAQISGILLSKRLERSGKVAMLLSLDDVKLRRAVRPGDQLVLEAQALHVRSRTGHCRCTAYVGDEVAAQAEIKFMLVDAEQAQ
jgi:UDP-3-O-[3-hydroxymyristoyl] N-acetylglucosamine deacetylase/3-hydroxyacyl-[acyl-carrier-protein] dehydratase